MRAYTIVKISGAPDWQIIPALPIDTALWGTGATNIRAQARLAYDDAALWVRLRAWETAIRAEYRGRPHPVSQDSCLEFFFCPTEGDTRYFNVEFNPNGALFLGFGSGLDDLTRLLVSDEQTLFSPVPFIAEGGWGIEYRLPFAFVRRFIPRFAPGAGSSIRANCYKCGDKTPRPHYIAWNPVAGDVPCFHRPMDFGRMIFG